MPGTVKDTRTPTVHEIHFPCGTQSRREKQLTLQSLRSVTDISTTERKTQSAPQTWGAQQALERKRKMSRALRSQPSWSGEKRQPWRWDRGTKGGEGCSRQKESRVRGRRGCHWGSATSEDGRIPEEEVGNGERRGCRGAQGSARHAKELKLHPLGERQPLGEPASAKQARCLREGKWRKRTVTHQKFVWYAFGVRMRNICLTWQVLLLPWLRPTYTSTCS